MYAEGKKSIYITLEASLIFRSKLSKILEEIGYQRNEYNWCVMSNIIHNKQFTILWHFDDLKTSHVDPAVVSIVLAHIMRNMGRLQK